MTICGHCLGEMPEEWEFREGRCCCGRRAITSMPVGTLVHKEGCDGGDNCPCIQGLIQQQEEVDRWLQTAETGT